MKFLELMKIPNVEAGEVTEETVDQEGDEDEKKEGCREEEFSYEDDFECPPLYEVYARLGEMYMTGQKSEGSDAVIMEQDGDKGYECYQVAAEMAISVGKGKLANQYFMKAEGM